MKYLLICLLAVITGFGSVQAAENRNSIDVNDRISAEEIQLTVQYSAAAAQRIHSFAFSEMEALRNFDVPPLEDFSWLAAAGQSDCEVSITVTVRVGLDSNFVEVSATLSGVKCDQVMEAVRKLKSDLTNGLSK